MQLLKRAINQKNQVESELKSAKRELKNMPKGTLHCRRRGDNWRWIYYIDGKEKSLSKTSQQALAERLAYKKRLERFIEDKENERIALDCYIKIMTCENSKFYDTSIGRHLITYDHKLHKTNEEFERLADAYQTKENPVVAAYEEQVRLAVEEDVQRFAGKNIDVDQYRIKSSHGLRFRSKSEALIYDCLRNHNLLVLYEKSLELNNGLIRSPDFTIYNPTTREHIIWEHFGMMDQPDYREKNIKKLAEYFDSGYYPGINMIATFETGDNSLNLQYIEMLIETFFE